MPGETFEYDAVGSRVKQIKNGVTTASVYNAANQIRRSTTAGVTTRYFYDANGNQVRKVTPGAGGSVEITKYDELNRRLSWKKTGGGAPKTESATYRGAEWHRASQTASGITTSYLYDGTNVVADVVAGNIQTAYVTPFLDQNLSITRNGVTHYYSQDGLGSVRTLTDANGIVKSNYDYSAYGETFTLATTETVANRYQYTGREKNGVSGTMSYRYRTAYVAALGIFTNRNPWGYIQGRMSLYDAMANNPVNGTEPFSEYTPVEFRLLPSKDIVIYPTGSETKFDAAERGLQDQEINPTFVNDAERIGVTSIEDAKLKISRASKNKKLKNLQIDGHGAPGIQNVGPERGTSDPKTREPGFPKDSKIALGKTTKINLKTGQPEAVWVNMNFFDSFYFQKKCTIWLTGCHVA